MVKNHLLHVYLLDAGKKGANWYIIANFCLFMFFFAAAADTRSLSNLSGFYLASQKKFNQLVPFSGLIDVTFLISCKIKGMTKSEWMIVNVA